MGIDLTALEPQQISRNLKGKFIFIYGEAKIGKTSLASELEKVLIASFEMGSNALHNVYVAPVRTWSDWKDMIRQLTRNKNKLNEKFNTIAIDTVDEAYKLCEKWVCNQNGVESLKDIPWGGGYKILDDEFSSTLRELAFSGYGLFFISHSKEKTYKNDAGEEYVKIVPALPERPFNIVNKMVDIIGYVRQIPIQIGEEIEQKRYLFLRGDDRFHAGSRFKYIEPKIELSYNNLVNAIYSAIDKEVAENGGTTTESENPYITNNFDVLMEDAKQLWNKATINDKVNDVLKILEEEFGKPTRFSEITANQIDELSNAIARIKDIV